MENKKCLAFYMYPEPKGTRYFEDDLNNEDTVEILFDYCSLWYAIIYKEGWEFLIGYYGYQKLFEINEKSGWIDASTIEEFVDEINREKDNFLRAIPYKDCAEDA